MVSQFFNFTGLRTEQGQTLILLLDSEEVKQIGFGGSVCED